MRESTTEPRTVVCYGDSNTWGSDTATGGRQPLAERWTTVLADDLGPTFQVIAEGLGGRTTVFDDPSLPGRAGSTFLLPCLWSHAPLEWVALMLGTNDTKAAFAATAETIADGLGTLIEMIIAEVVAPDGRPPRILVVAPPPLGEPALASGSWDDSGVAESRRLAEAFRSISARHGCRFLDAGTIISTSAADGVHLDVDALRVLGAAVAQVILG